MSTVLVAYVVTLFLSSFLMFLMEPMAAKMVLPLLGGAPAVWNTCVVFFQGMLLVGYAYAHEVPRWLGARRHALLHVVLVVLPLIGLPFVLRSGSVRESQPISSLLTLLVTSIGLPFFALTTTAPLLQKWFSRTDHPDAKDPYFLYTASNLGSLAGLLLYPGLFELTLRLRDQARVWSVGYAIFAALAVGCAAIFWYRAPGSVPVERIDPDARSRPLSIARRFRWGALAFAPSSLMLAVTSFVSTDIAAVPLLWIVPLALYLVSFVLAFDSSSRYPHALVNRAFPLVTLPLVFLLIMQASGPKALVIPVHLAAFFLAALICHRKLADDRPDPEHLTEFYLWIALGGIVGSLFNTLAAPVLFTGIVEYPLVLVAVCLLRGVPDPPVGAPSRQTPLLAAAVVAGGFTAILMASGSRLESTGLRWGLLAIPAFLSLRVSRARIPFALAIGLMLLASLFRQDELGTVVHAERTFFGTYRVLVDAKQAYRSLYHGTTLHGMQSLRPERRGEPLTYYHPTGPFGALFKAIPITSSHPQVAVVGLGVGSLAAYRHQGQRWTFYEIDPAVERIARNSSHFTFLSDCTMDCQVVLGDARLSLNAASHPPFGLIVLDAFSSDAIPVHLVTREAIELYLSRLATRGVLAFHISNRHLNLEPVLARLAEQLQLTAVIRRERVTQDEMKTGKSSADWLVMVRERPDLGALDADPNWTEAKTSSGVRLWTDDFSNILTVLAR